MAIANNSLMSYIQGTSTILIKKIDVTDSDIEILLQELYLQAGYAYIER
jgi:hypothetical protein